ESSLTKPRVPAPPPVTKVDKLAFSFTSIAVLPLTVQLSKDFAPDTEKALRSTSETVAPALISLLRKVERLRVVSDPGEAAIGDPAAIGKAVGARGVLVGKLFDDERGGRGLYLKFTLLDAKTSFPVWTGEYRIAERFEVLRGDATFEKTLGERVP